MKQETCESRLDEHSEHLRQDECHRRSRARRTYLSCINRPHPAQVLDSWIERSFGDLSSSSFSSIDSNDLVLLSGMSVEWLLLEFLFVAFILGLKPTGNGLPVSCDGRGLLLHGSQIDEVVIFFSSLVITGIFLSYFSSSFYFSLSRLESDGTKDEKKMMMTSSSSYLPSYFSPRVVIQYSFYVQKFCIPMIDDCLFWLLSTLLFFLFFFFLLFFPLLLFLRKKKWQIDTDQKLK